MGARKFQAEDTTCAKAEELETSRCLGTYKQLSKVVRIREWVELETGQSPGLGESRTGQSQGLSRGNERRVSQGPGLEPTGLVSWLRSLDTKAPVCQILAIGEPHS